MKLDELLNPKNLLEGINAAVMQQKIYEYVLKKMKELNPDMHYSYAGELARTTDEFFSDKLDDVHEAFNKAESFGEIEDLLSIAIEDVSEVIVDFFSDESKHPTGYSARKLKPITDVSSSDLEELIRKIDPSLKDLLK